MKKHILLVGAVTLLCLAVAFLTQHSVLRQYNTSGTGQPVFRDDLEIIAVTLDSNINHHGTEVIPEASMEETVAWLRQFTIGKPLSKKNPLRPGSGSIWIIVTYENGTTQETAIDHIQIDSSYYQINRPNLPAVLPPLD